MTNNLTGSGEIGFAGRLDQHPSFHPSYASEPYSVGLCTYQSRDTGIHEGARQTSSPVIACASIALLPGR